jgi:hypothetical protein
MSVNRIGRSRLAALALAGTALMSAGPALAQAAPSDSAMVNLVRLLVEQKVITRAAGDALMQQAEAEAQQARAAAAAPAAQANAGLPPTAPGTIRVPYIPETVRAQIKDELRTEVLAQAKSEGWAAPDKGAPDWTRKITLYGDVRFRSQSDLYSKSNSNQIVDFARINNNGPTDVINDPIPFLNSTKDRLNQLRLRARLGLKADISPHIQAGFVLATGDDAGPISTNVSLGGGLGKRDIWLQDAWFKVLPTEWSSVSFGRFENPFRSTELLFDPDLAFDGVAANVELGKMFGDRGIDFALRGGAFPLDFGDANFPSNDPDKRGVAQKYLLSAQAELGVNINDDIRLDVAAAYHDFVNVQGQLSEPCALYAGATECNTDGRRPFFLRKGNTLSPLRQIAVDPSLPAGSIQPQPQFFGLTFDYNVLNVNASVSYKFNDDISLVATGDYIRNLAFKRRDLCRNGIAGEPFNNGKEVDYNGDGTPDSTGDICATTKPTRFVGGNQGYLGMLTIGHREVRRWGQWSAQVGYRYLQSDATLDSLTDSDFHLGGTNAKGYFVGGKMGLFDGMSVGARWLSANEITGEPFAIDVFQLDLQVAF